MHKRWLSYLAIGLLFGVIDWYFLDILSKSLTRLSQDGSLLEHPVWRLVFLVTFLTLNYGVWLVPVVPTAVVEMRISGSLRQAAAAASLLWSAAIFSYYAFYTLLLLFAGLPNLEFMLFANRDSPTYWSDFWPPFERLIVEQVLDWMAIALVGGAIVGALSGWIFARIQQRRSAPAS